MGLAILVEFEDVALVELFNGVIAVVVAIVDVLEDVIAFVVFDGDDVVGIGDVVDVPVDFVVLEVVNGVGDDVDTVEVVEVIVVVVDKSSNFGTLTRTKDLTDFDFGIVMHITKTCKNILNFNSIF